MVGLLSSSMYSCISDDDVEQTPECVITGFSVGDITSMLTATASDGTDSTYTRTISGSSIKFNIDQINGRIYSIDSLPSWTNLTRVVPTITYSGTVYARLNADSVYYSITSGSDSIDLSTPMDFLVTATDGVSKKHYSVAIHRYSANADSLLWSPISNNLKLTGNQKLIVANEKLYVFANASETPSMSVSTDGITWSEPTALKTVANKIDCQSILTFNGRFYALDSDGKIYTSEDAEVWTIASETVVKSLPASDKTYLYAYDGEKIIATKDLMNWEINGTDDIDMFPETCLSSQTYNTRTNSDLQVDVLAGLTRNNTTDAVIWYKVSSSEASSNQQWDYITVTDENPYPLPALSNLKMFHYNDVLYAIGGDNNAFYKSEDNGITWRKVTQYQFPPVSLVADKNVAVSVQGNFIWIIQTDSNGEVKIWKGIINKLG